MIFVLSAIFQLLYSEITNVILLEIKQNASTKTVLASLEESEMCKNNFSLLNFTQTFRNA